MVKDDQVVIFTDGGAIGNPGPGGYGVVILSGENRKELSGGYRLTTNNRMEMMAVIEGLKTLKGHQNILIYSDSRYVVDSINKGWAKGWRAKGWKKKSKGKALNIDLWKQLLDLIEGHDITLQWVRGHSGNRENERCDRLSGQNARRKDLPVDSGYENGYQEEQPSLF
ncbi:MAG: ribonuclease HI [Anaerolineaceae bacterium]|nr:ribonuclease HI [Anaerolineaceae bacterium]